MNYFTPKRFPSLTVYFEFEPGQRQTFHDPGFPDEYEFTEIEVEGVRLDEELETHLIETFAEDWEIELNEIRFERDI
jgi:hypothetical protein